jgi:hypothetical protein
MRRTRHLCIVEGGRVWHWFRPVVPIVLLGVLGCHQNQLEGRKTGAAPHGQTLKTAEIPTPWMLTVQSTDGRGVRVSAMDIRSFAAPLLAPGDVVLAVDGRTVNTVEELDRSLLSLAPGAVVVVTILRSETRIDYVMFQIPDGSNASPESGLREPVFLRAPPWSDCRGVAPSAVTRRR